MATSNNVVSDAASVNPPIAEIRQFIFQQYPLARKRTLENTDPLLERGILDSLGILDLVAFIEETFSIKVSDEDLVPENFQTIDQIAAFVRSKATGRDWNRG